MLRFVARRLVWAIPTLLLVTFLVYVAIRIGTNPSEAYQRSNPRANAAKIAEYEELNNLNGSYVSGYFRWLGGLPAGPLQRWRELAAEHHRPSRGAGPNSKMRWPTPCASA